jgi:hypothetical protein
MVERILYMNKEQLIEKRLRLEGQFKGGAGWFYWIAGLSVLNTVITLLGGDWVFIVGLGITQVIEIFAQTFAVEWGNNSFIYVGIIINLLIAGIFVFFGIYSSKKSKSSFIVGMIFYAMDTIFFIIALDLLGIAFHAFALYNMIRGFRALKKIDDLDKEMKALTQDVPPADPETVESL